MLLRGKPAETQKDQATIVLIHCLLLHVRKTSLQGLLGLGLLSPKRQPPQGEWRRDRQQPGEQSLLRNCLAALTRDLAFVDKVPKFLHSRCLQLLSLQAQQPRARYINMYIIYRERERERERETETERHLCYPCSVGDTSSRHTLGPYKISEMSLQTVLRTPYVSHACGVRASHMSACSFCNP